MKKRNKESEEMYLETILLLSIKKGIVHAVDLRHEFNYAKSTISEAVKSLKDKGYINFDSNTGLITFTEEGFNKANEVFNRHQVITKVLKKIGAGDECAESNACRIEHVVDDEIMSIFENFIK